jgi:hypothetical protein
MSSLNNASAPLGFEMARELTATELERVGGGLKKGTLNGKVTHTPQGNDGEVSVDYEW